MVDSLLPQRAKAVEKWFVERFGWIESAIFVLEQPTSTGATAGAADA
ncbi:MULTISPECIES: hypothetical protein [unclassified Yimella]|nr:MULTISPECIES: hypothetical protein [unclassified Yimella]MCG8654115.1 hypothetical protein [Yimella sp. NH-Cas1]